MGDTSKSTDVRAANCCGASDEDSASDRVCEANICGNMETFGVSGLTDTGDIVVLHTVPDRERADTILMAAPGALPAHDGIPPVATAASLEHSRGVL